MPLLKTEAPDLENIDKWINSDPVKIKDGTYLLYFWNYSCRCCRSRLKLFERIHRTYPEIRVVGIHKPEFEFEQDGENLEKAVEKLEVEHTVAHDRIGKISDNYDMAYSSWALVVHEGSIVHQQTRQMGIGELEDKLSDIIELDKADDQELNHETVVPSQKFFGYSRAKGLNEEGNHPGEKRYQFPENRKKDTIYLNGKWNQAKSYIEAGENSKLQFRFKLSELKLVLNPDDGLRDIEVLIDGEPVPETDAGDDMRIEDGRSYVRVKNPDLYSLIESDCQESEITLLPDKKTRFYALSYR